MCPIIDVAVFGLNSSGDIVGHEEDELIDIIQRTVADFRGQSRIFNLSLGFEYSVTDGVFSELAKNLDYLARENDVLFIIASGNISTPSVPHPEQFLADSARIQPPAESLLGLTVGALARHTTSRALSRAGEVSPFSCRGPGADGGQKPEVTAHGGNLVAAWDQNPRIGTFGLSGSGTQLAFENGTSCAAPLAAQMAARLEFEYQAVSTNLIKALLCHFADPVSSPVVALDPRHLSGLGCPNVDRALFAGDHSVAYLYDGRLIADTYQHIPFFVPGTLSEGSGRSLKVSVTLVYNPPVDPDNADEYSKARIVCSLHKRVDVGFRQVPMSPAGGLVGKPWNPLIHFEKGFARQYSTGDWEIRLRLITRGELSDLFEQTYALIVEVIDTSGGTDVRSDIMNEAGATLEVVALRSAA